MRCRVGARGAQERVLTAGGSIAWSCGRCLQMIQEYEAMTGSAFHFVVRSRPDIAVLTPLPPLCSFSRPGTLYMAGALQSDWVRALGFQFAPLTARSTGYRLLGQLLMTCMRSNPVHRRSTSAIATSPATRWASFGSMRNAEACCRGKATTRAPSATRYTQREAQTRALATRTDKHMELSCLLATSLALVSSPPSDPPLFVRAGAAGGLHLSDEADGARN